MIKNEDLSDFDIEIKLPDLSKDGFIFGLNEDDLKVGLPNAAARKYMQMWVDIIEKQKNPRDEWFELPWFPNHKFLNLRITSKSFVGTEISDIAQTIHFTYDKKINKEIEINLDK